MNIDYKIGDCREVMKELPDDSFDSCVTDAPYELEFMGKEWDKQGVAYDPDVWREVFRLLKPGAYLLNCGGTRTYDLMVGAVRKAEFEIRDMIPWIYGSGFPKSMDISKQIDKMGGHAPSEFSALSEEIKRARLEMGLSQRDIGQKMLESTDGKYGQWYHRGGMFFFESGVNLPSKAEWNALKKLLPIRSEFEDIYEEAKREIVAMGYRIREASPVGICGRSHGDFEITAPATPDAKKWSGYGTALKPSIEPIVVARKPISERNVALNVLKHGTGGLNVGACRIVPTLGTSNSWNAQDLGHPTVGRFPANLILEDDFLGEESRFFYVAKASRRERWFYCSVCNKAYSGDKREAHKKHSMKCLDCGVDYEPEYPLVQGRDGAMRDSDPFAMVGRLKEYNKPIDDHREHKTKTNLLFHVTQKPEQLIRYLIRLVTPKGGTVLDPFLGSGTTLVAARMEGMNALGIELSDEYEPLIKGRLNALPRALEEFHQPTTPPSPKESIKYTQETE